MKRLSIIVPIYNVERYVRSCMESIYNQGLDEKCFEVIIVNDGSTDRSMEVIDDLIHQHSNIIVINQKNLSLSVARNNGIAAAKGEYVLMIDSDDLLIENSLLLLLNKASERKADIIEANYLIKNDEEIEKQLRSKFEQPAVLIEETNGLELLRALKTCYVWNKLFRRDFILQNSLSFIPGIRFQDIPFTHECYLKAATCLKSNTFFNVYRRGHQSDSAPNNFDMDKARDFCMAIAATWKLTRTDTMTTDVRKIIKDHLLASYYDLLYRLMKFIKNNSDRVEILRTLQSMAPDLRFTDSKMQRISSWLSRKTPRLYFIFLSLYWKK